MKKENSFNPKVKVVGRISDHILGVVVDRTAEQTAVGCSMENPTVGGKEMEKKCKMIGLIDPTGYEIEQRVYSRVGCCKAIRSRDYKDAAKVLRRYDRQNNKDTGHV